MRGAQQQQRHQQQQLGAVSASQWDVAHTHTLATYTLAHSLAHCGGFLLFVFMCYINGFLEHGCADPRLVVLARMIRMLRNGKAALHIGNGGCVRGVGVARVRVHGVHVLASRYEWVAWLPWSDGADGPTVHVRVHSRARVDAETG